jgi:hypothetical protein
VRGRFSHGAPPYAARSDDRKRLVLRDAPTHAAPQRPLGGCLPRRPSPGWRTSRGASLWVWKQNHSASVSTGWITGSTPIPSIRLVCR